MLKLPRGRGNAGPEFSSDPTVPDGAFVIISDPAASHGKYILPPASLASDGGPGSAQAR